MLLDLACNQAMVDAITCQREINEALYDGICPDGDFNAFDVSFGTIASFPACTKDVRYWSDRDHSSAMCCWQGGDRGKNNPC
jgi:hypothetical protein